MQCSKAAEIFQYKAKIINKGKMKEKLKRNFWLTSEIECMLNLIKEMKKSQGTTQTTQTTFITIAAKMKKRGFSNKSPTQIRRKWFQMKSAYLCYKRGNSERLLLIPEKFRNTIAEFVDIDPSMSNNSIKSQQDYDNASDDQNSYEESSLKPQQPIKDEPPEQTYYQRRVSKFLSCIEDAHKLVMEDFKSMQEVLLDYQHKCQAERDANLINFIKSTGSINLNSYI